MATLPTVGGDVDTWGTELNDYLGVAHNPDGTDKLHGSYALSTGTSVGDVSLTLESAPGFPIGTVIVIDPYTTNCEVRKATSVSGVTVGVAALRIAHSLATRVLVITGDAVSFSLYGARGNAGVGFDNEPALQAAADDWSSHQQRYEGHQSIYYISKPLIQAGEMRWSNSYVYAMPSYTPSATNTAMLMMADVATAPYLSVTATAVDNVFTTPTAHGLADGAWLAFKGTMPGGVNAGQRYYVITRPSATTFTISATAGGSTLDVTLDGTCRVYRNLQATQRWWLDNVRANGNHVAPVGIIANVQQQSQCFNVRVDSCTAVGAYIFGQDGSWWNTEIINCPVNLAIQNPDSTTSAYMRFYQLNIEGLFDVGIRAYGHNNIIHDLHFEGGNAGHVGVEANGESLMFFGNTYMNPTPQNPPTTFFKLNAGDIVAHNVNAVSISDAGGGPPILLDDQVNGETVLLSDMTGDDLTAQIRLFDTGFYPGVGSGTNYQYLIRRTPGGYMKYGGNNVASHSLELRPETSQTGKLTRWLDTSGAEGISITKDAALLLGGAATIRSGSGVPSNALGVDGDFYFRTGTPGTVNQRLYVRSAGAYVGII